jgi:MerR family transcriptional regulator, heat shock protein HspR
MMKTEIDNYTPVYSIGVMAKLLDISVQTIRMYEHEALLIPFKKDSKHRLYSKNDFERLQCIRDAIIQHKFSIAAIKTIYSMVPCWSIKKCSNEERLNCEAYNGFLQPCWAYKHDNNICSLQNCVQCEVYTNHSNCGSIKTTIKNLTKK